MTPSPNPLAGLLERVERASEPDRDLDGDLYWVLCPNESDRVYWNGATGLPKAMDHTKPIPNGMGRAGVRVMSSTYTASVDAALALMEQCLPGWVWSVQTDFGLPGRAYLYGEVFGERDAGFHADGATPPLALLAALLKALLANSSGGGA